MSKALVKNSDIIVQKSKFFLNRILIYFSFLLIPVWLQKTIQTNFFTQASLMLLYLMFLAGQWYLLGKEIDHRFKIYFRANSSIDRILYRLLIGLSSMILIMNVMSFIPEQIVRHFFWGFFVVLGLFYSWPTRGKIIEESVSTQFTEYKYLDSFEKTVVLLSLALFLFSFPSFPFFSNLETLKLMIDPDEKIHSQFWSYLQMTFFPFKKFPLMMNLGWSMHFYFVSFSLYVSAFYGILRFFFSRRISILGLFALLSTWSLSLILKRDVFSCLHSTFSLLWVWSILWCLKSSTYRSGLMYGLVCYFGVVLNYNYFFLYPVGLAYLFFIFFSDATDWYKSQFVKYTLLGFFIIILTLLSHPQVDFFSDTLSSGGLMKYFSTLLKRKAFYQISVIGFLTLTFSLLMPKLKVFVDLKLDFKKLKFLLLLVVTLVVFGLMIDKSFVQDFGLLWFVVFLSLVPLEWVFLTLSRLRSKRNVLYALYVLVCLLDSHFEGRIRLVYQFLSTKPSIVEFIHREG